MPRVLIAGCGYVGSETARLFAASGWETIGVVRSESSLSRLGGEAFSVRRCDLATPAEVSEKLGDLHGIDLVVHCASSSGGGADDYRRVYLEGARNLLALKPKNLIFTSSTSVYAQADGEWVTEESPAQPDRETGRILAETESLVLGYPGGIVTRLAGIYGPGRFFLLKKFLDGVAVIEGDGERFLNMIHRDDAASALFFLGGTGDLPPRRVPPTSHSDVATTIRPLFNVCDDRSLSQIECYRWLAEHFKRPLPPFGPIDSQRKRGATNKRVSNAKLRNLGWSPRYSSFFEAIEGGLAAL